MNPAARKAVADTVKEINPMLVRQQMRFNDFKEARKKTLRILRE